MKLPAAGLATTLALLSSAPAGQVAPGHRLYGPDGSTLTFLVDTAGNTVHTWPGAHTPGNGMYLEADGTLVRTGKLLGNPGPGGSGGNVQRIAFDGTVLWDFDYANAQHWQHHDVEPLPNGNVLLIAWDILTKADATSAGRDPALLTANRWMPDTLVEVQQTGPTTGTVVWKWSVMDHLIQDFDATKANFGVVADHPELLDINFPPEVSTGGDWNHGNSVSYDPLNDIVLINFPFQSEFYLIDHSTTTAEAAGHTGGNFGRGGDFLYRWGNPQAYGAGTAANQKLSGQHGSKFIPAGLPGAGHVLGFNNKAGTSFGLPFSAVYELELPASFALPSGAAWGPNDFVWEYTAPLPSQLYSGVVSSAVRTETGNTLVCSGRQNGWLFEVTNAGNLVWQYFNTVPAPAALVFQVSYVERTLWADRETLSAASGGAVDFDLVAGSDYGGSLYWLLGSATGTSPGLPAGAFTLPLNFDGYFSYTLFNPSSPLLPASLGFLDPLGNTALPGFVLPPATTLAGVTLHHAAVVIDPATFATQRVSNPVPLAIGP